MLQKNKLPFKNPYLLAPMEEVNDIAFRLLCKEAGNGKILTYTGMIHPLTQQELVLDDKPILQLFCTEPVGIENFIKKYDSKVSGWDFNLGCPAKNARRKGFGSYLTDLKKIEEILKIIRQNTKKPFSIKIRKSKNSFKLLKLAEKYCDLICIHPRTQAQGYGGKADLNYAIEFKKKSKIPVIYSGDVNEENAASIIKENKFDAVMIGRSAIGNPNIFAELTDNKEIIKNQITFQDYLKLAKRYNLYFRQIKFQAMNFTKGKDNAKELRLKIFETKNINDLIKIKELF